MVENKKCRICNIRDAIDMVYMDENEVWDVCENCKATLEEHINE